MESHFVASQHSVKIYERSHQLKCEAKIIKLIKQQVKIVQHGKSVFVDAVGLVLDNTIFHPQGGGQPSDRGTIDGIPVLTVREDKMQNPTQIYHFFDISENNDYFNVAQVVALDVDGKYRQKCSISHTAGHLLADILEFHPYFTKYNARSTHGHHFPDGEYIKAIIAIDIDNKEQFINSLNQCLSKEIANNLPISCDYYNGIRHIKIGSSNRMCGGTHLTMTGEIISCIVKKIKVSKVNKDGVDVLEATLYYDCSNHRQQFTTLTANPPKAVSL